MKTLSFLLQLWKTNLLSAMEYRAAFITQILGMILNNTIYFLIWVIFFERFKEIRGWGLSDMFLVFGVAAAAFGLGVFLFGNALMLSDLIAQGKLDYYLSLPRPVLLHAIASRSVTSGLGDMLYGLLSYCASGLFSPSGLLRFLLGVLLAAMVFVSFMVLAQSLAFWFGNASAFTSLLVNAMITFAIYPVTLFEGGAKFILFTIIPAALMGAVPASFVRAFDGHTLALLALGASVLLVFSVAVFYRGLRRYESGSAIQNQV